MTRNYVVREKRFKVEPFGRVEIFDPGYDAPGGITRSARAVSASCSLPTSNRTAGVLMQEIHGTFENHGKTEECMSFMVRFYSYNNGMDWAEKTIEAIIKAECEDQELDFYAISSKEDEIRSRKWHKKISDLLSSEGNELSCDTSEFTIRIDGRERRIQTLADGSYGRVERYKKKNVMYFDFFLDSEVTGWEELEDKVRYLFRVMDEGDTWSGKKPLNGEKRKVFGKMNPTGWHTVRYDSLYGYPSGTYLYNKCRLMSPRLTGENDVNRQELFTGTHHLNTMMSEMEDTVAEYVVKTGKHVLYRVTPEFTGNELLARSVLIEGWSTEDNGKGVCFNVRLMNIQPGIVIDYATGENSIDPDFDPDAIGPDCSPDGTVQ